MPRAAGSCAEAGVLGTAVGVMGTLQAHLALAVLLKCQPTPLGRLISVDFRTLHLGGFSFADAREPAGTAIAFIAPAEVSVADLVIDLRSLAEAPVSQFPSAMRIGVEALEQARMSFPAERRIVLCCRTGVRAWRAARALHTLARFDTQAMCAVTAVTVQSDSRVIAVRPLAPDTVRAQIESALATGRVGAIKIGMLGTGAIARAVAACLPPREQIPMVLDPVLASSSGAALLDAGGREVLRAGPAAQARPSICS